MSEVQEESTFTEEQQQELVDWLESLTLAEIQTIKNYWESITVATIQ